MIADIRAVRRDERAARIEELLSEVRPEGGWQEELGDDEGSESDADPLDGEKPRGGEDPDA